MFGVWSRCVVVGRPPEVAVFESVAVAFEADDVGVVDEPVDHRGGDDGISEHFAPATERFVRRDDQAGAFVARRDELEEEVRGVGFEGDVADLVDDEERHASEARIPMPVARWVLPVPGGPRNTMLDRSAMKSRVPRCATWSRLRLR